MVLLNSSFDCRSLARLTGNIFIPGSGNISLLCKYGCEFGIFKIAIIQNIMEVHFLFQLY